MDDYTITTIYYDGQFWIALVEKCIDNCFFSARHIFGAEPTNPEVLNFMLYGFDKLKMIPVAGEVKIRVKKENTAPHSIKKSLDAFKDAQKQFFDAQKKETRTLLRQDKKIQFEQRRQKKKKQKRH